MSTTKSYPLSPSEQTSTILGQEVAERVLEDVHVRAGYILGIVFVLLIQKYFILFYFTLFYLFYLILFHFIAKLGLSPSSTLRLPEMRFISNFFHPPTQPTEKAFFWASRQLGKLVVVWLSLLGLISFVHNFLFAHFFPNFCSQHLFTIFVHEFSSQLLFATFVKCLFLTFFTFLGAKAPLELIRVIK